jgi:hypothetical protein
MRFDAAKLFTRVRCQQQESLIPRSACNSFCICASANLFEPVAKVPRINPRRVTYCSIVIVVLKQELFGFALPAKRATDPLLNGPGEHGAPKLLFGYFLRSIVINQSLHLSPSCWPLPLSLTAQFEEANGVPFRDELIKMPGRKPI